MDVHVHTRDVRATHRRLATRRDDPRFSAFARCADASLFFSLSASTRPIPRLQSTYSRRRRGGASRPRARLRATRLQSFHGSRRRRRRIPREHRPQRTRRGRGTHRRPGRRHFDVSRASNPGRHPRASRPRRRCRSCWCSSCARAGRRPSKAGMRRAIRRRIPLTLAAHAPPLSTLVRRRRAVPPQSTCGTPCRRAVGDSTVRQFAADRP